MQFDFLHYSCYFVSFAGNCTTLRIEPKQEMFPHQCKTCIHMVQGRDKIPHYSTRNMIGGLLIHL